MSETVRYKNKDGQVAYVEYDDLKIARVSKEELEQLLKLSGFERREDECVRMDI